MTIFGSRSRLLWSADYFYKLQIRLCQISIEVFFGAPGEANCYDKEKKLVWMLENNTKDNQKITFVPVSIKISFKLVSHFQKNVQMRAKMLSVYWFRPWLPTVLLDIGDEVVFITRLFASHENQEIKFKLSLKSWAHDHTYSEAVFYHRKTDLRREAANLLFFTLLSADLHKIENGKCVILPHQFSWGRIFEVPTIQVLLDASV